MDWRIDNLDTVMETWESVRVLSGAAQAGPFTTVVDTVALVADQHTYTSTHGAGTEATWYVIELYESGGPTSGDKTDPVAGTGGGDYLTVEDLRGYGWTVPALSNDAARKAIAEAEAALLTYTQQRFVAEQKTVELDGNGAKLLPMLEAIIQIDEIQMLGGYVDLNPILSEVDVDAVKVANRHLTQRLINPDDRRAPSLTFEHLALAPAIQIDHWAEGTQNIRLSGWFGFTELEPGETAGVITDTQLPLSRGRTPLIVKRACMLLAAQMIATPADPGAYAAATKAYALTKNKMRDQEQTWSATTLRSGSITGDFEVDTWIASFQAPVSVEMV
ncbi:MAG: hypothetical protein GTN69_06930 [Armatimonadetes bacterium]|nr:hypothetical protein [Armatimonadota bacterium]